MISHQKQFSSECGIDKSALPRRLLNPFLERIWPIEGVKHKVKYLATNPNRMIVTYVTKFGILHPTEKLYCTVLLTSQSPPPLSPLSPVQFTTTDGAELYRIGVAGC